VFLRIFKPEMRRCAGMLICLTLLFVCWQLAFFLVHFKVTQLLDSLVSASIVLELLHSVVLIPILFFITLQLAAYVYLLMMIVWITSLASEFIKLSSRTTYWLGVLCLISAFIFLLTHNAYFYPSSFFAIVIEGYGVTSKQIAIAFFTTSFFLSAMMIMSLLQLFRRKRFSILDVMILTGMMLIIVVGIFEAILPYRINHHVASTASHKPNVILIGLDSLRPDFTGYGGNVQAKTPHIDDFLKQGFTYTQAYTPLARTFPAWVSILTSKHPKHSLARNNLVDSQRILTHDTMARYFQRLGYETIYATDEKRFSNITREYGFDHVLGPEMGVNDFLLGGFGDFPMVNFLLHSPFGRFLLPYHYGNRAAHVTYQPNDFLQQVRVGLLQRKDKPLFLAIHLCLSHWPFTWARDHYHENTNIVSQYIKSVTAVDQQLGQLLTILKAQGLLDQSWVVLLSDHGTALGLPHDRLTDYATYRGDPIKLNWVPLLKLSNPPAEKKGNAYTINTSYGQGTNILSFPQNRVLLSFRHFGSDLLGQAHTQVSSLLDIWPTLIDAVHGPTVTGLEGQSLYAGFNGVSNETQARLIFLETGDSLNEIETDKIYIEKVIKREIGIYQINAENGLLTIAPEAEASIIKNKQLAILSGDWMLAHFPVRGLSHLVFTNQKSQLTLKTDIIPAYFVVANLKTKEWTIDLTSPLAHQGNAENLLKLLRDYYPGEV